nr:putative disease resistance RPP13-like protein 1 isoform X1 [Quercus suber]
MAVFLGQALATSIIQVALDRLASHEVIDYFKGRKLNQKLLQNLEFVLLSANSVLIDAEEKQFTNSAVKKWLDELKDAVYVADDLLDEIATEALRSKSEAKLQTRTKKCHFLLSITSDTPTINFMPLVVADPFVLCMNCEICEMFSSHYKVIYSHSCWSCFCLVIHSLHS